MPHIAILGAGTAGLACAIATARVGCRVTLFERHPDLAPVGAGLLIQPSGIRALHALGVGEAFMACSVPVRRLEGLSHRGWRLVDIQYGTDVARGVSRHALTTLLQHEARSLGVDLRWGAPVEDIAPDGDTVKVRLDPSAAALGDLAFDRGHLAVQERTAPAAEETFDAAIVASGSGSCLGVRCGLSAPSTLYRWGALNAMFEVSDWPAFHDLQQRFHGPRRMFGLMPTALHGNRQVLSMFWSLPTHAHPVWLQSSLSDWKAQLLQLWPQSAPVVDQIHAHDQFAFATYRHAWPKRLAAGRICLVGDAAHAMSPQLGLGSTLAVGDALSLAGALQDEPGVEAAFARYERERRSHVKRVQVLSRLLTPCFQADLPAWWRDAAFAASLHVPGMKSLMLKSLDA
jgi:2-polyprenyl-6-methoxyphenol hydroxylase-like FAD-dependent oxidoreductase